MAAECLETCPEILHCHKSYLLMQVSGDLLGDGMPTFTEQDLKSAREAIQTAEQAAKGCSGPVPLTEVAVRGLWKIRRGSPIKYIDVTACGRGGLSDPVPAPLPVVH